MNQNNETKNISVTRTEIAFWYGISERGLRYQMNEAKISIKNRILTFDDVKAILIALGTPQNLPRELYNLYFVS